VRLTRRAKIKIVFTDTLGIPEEYKPLPASLLLPDWYKNLESYMSGEKKPNGEGTTTGTAKRCMPIFDAITSGYIIFTHSDLWISQRPDENTGKIVPYYEWAHFGAIQFHPKGQLPQHPDGRSQDVAYPKWMNAWSIKTPPGYSTLFVSPLHRETPIMCLPGVVDTDTYTAPVNFPFVLKDPKMEGLIPAGTPIVQVIPLKRDAWKIEFGSQEDLNAQEKIFTKLRTKFFDSYKTQYRQPKEYR
jgi:hypothetical protein